ncbi:hypothetical protein CBL_03746 [Carabus blaptoides fortunei]
MSAVNDAEHALGELHRKPPKLAELGPGEVEEEELEETHQQHIHPHEQLTLHNTCCDHPIPEHSSPDMPRIDSLNSNARLAFNTDHFSMKRQCAMHENPTGYININVGRETAMLLMKISQFSTGENSRKATTNMPMAIVDFLGHNGTKYLVNVKGIKPAKTTMRQPL